MDAVGVVCRESFCRGKQMDDIEHISLLECVRAMQSVNVFVNTFRLFPQVVKMENVRQFVG